MGKIPVVWRRLPSRDSSPRRIVWETSAYTCSELRRMPTAMGKS